MYAAECDANLSLGVTIMGQCADSPLTARGVAQARALGEELSTMGIVFDAVYTSNAVRAIRTAAIALTQQQIQQQISSASAAGNMAIVTAAAAHSLIAVSTPALLEQGQGQWEGKSRSLMTAAETIAAQKKEAYDWHAPGMYPPTAL